MGLFAYMDDSNVRTSNGVRTMFDRLTGCILCGRRPLVVVGIFVPRTDYMRGLLVRLRHHALPMNTSTTACVAYGLCRHCFKHADVADRVDAALVAAAEKIPVH